MLPAVQRLPKLVFNTPTKTIFGLQSKFTVNIHLMPGDLVDHHHSTPGLKLIQCFPQRYGLLLYGECRDLSNLATQFSEDISVFVARNHS